MDGASEDRLPGLSPGLIARSAAPAPGTAEKLDHGESFLPDILPVPMMMPEEVPLPGEPEVCLPAPVASLSGLLLARKGKARAAPSTDATAINHLLAPEPAAPAEPGPLTGRHILITAGPTHEAIDPVRYIANRSSGKQGFAIAAAAAALGARVSLVAGPVHLPTPPGVDRIDVESARDMAEAVKRALPADVAVMVAAVADWRSADTAVEKIKKRGSAPPALMLAENPDILATLGASADRPPLLIGFAAETESVLAHALEKRRRKGADWIIANDVSGGPGASVMGGEVNAVHIVTADGVESLPEMPKHLVAEAIVRRIAEAIGPAPLAASGKVA